MKGLTRRTRLGFSLVELVVVIVIIGIIAAMAIPRLSRGSAGAGDSALAGNLAVLRNAINMYAAEHVNKFPGHDSGNMKNHLIQYSTEAGAVQATRDASHKFGPYLAAFPPCPVGNPSDPTGVLISATSPPTVDTTNGEGWVYNLSTGEIIANTNASDASGKTYKSY